MPWRSGIGCGNRSATMPYSDSAERLGCGGKLQVACGSGKSEAGTDGRQEGVQLVQRIPALHVPLRSRLTP